MQVHRFPALQAPAVPHDACIRRSAHPHAEKIGFATACLGIAALLAACGGPAGPNPSIERARVEVDRVAAMPTVTEHAPLELKQAIDSVERADREWREDGDQDEARHDAYVAERQAAIAENLARSRDADEKLELANATADRQRLEANRREATAARQDANAQAQQAAAVRQQASAQAAAANERIRQLETQLRQIEARQTERGLLVTLGDVLFESGQADLLPTAEPRLDDLAAFLRENPDRKLLVEGYTDAVGNDRYNMDLSQRRADSVRRALVLRGVDPARINTRGYGENFAIADNESPEGRALNRRVEVMITDRNGNLRPRG